MWNVRLAETGSCRQSVSLSDLQTCASGSCADKTLRVGSPEMRAAGLEVHNLNNELIKDASFGENCEF